MIYVDDLVDYSRITGRPSPDLWCHMVTDGPLEELHQFAERMGMQRAWFQNKPGHPHYDLKPAGRARAIELGAKAVNIQELLEAIKRGLAGQNPTEK